jgi:hypothetical protein
MFKLETLETSQNVISDAVDTYKRANPYRYKDKERYVKILNGFYDKEIKRRLDLLYSIKDSRENIKHTLIHISKREHIVDFITDWCWTYDPRLATVGLPTVLPMIPFPRQVEFLEWIYKLYLNQERGLIEKSRDAGATWFFVIMMTFEWRWTEGFAGGIGSNKLDNVDSRDNPDCIFEKIRTLMKLLPPFWMPRDFDVRKHDKVGSLYNKEMGSYVTGQGGKDIGRGGRRSIYLVDESASLEFPLGADAALSANTNCQVDLSTPKGMNHFGQKRHSGNLKVFTFHYKDDPRKDDEWFEVQKKELDPVVLAQEVLINYHASVEGLFIRPEWVQAAIDLDLKPVGDRGAGLDVAAGGTNKSALALRYGPVVSVQSFNIENAIDLTHLAIDLCNKAGSDYLNYDLIGVGYAVKSSIERTEKTMDFPYYGLEAGESPSDLFYEELGKKAKDAFVNARAEWWYLMARRFEKTFEHVSGIRQYPHEELISIPNNGELIAQLSSPKKFHTENGKIKCESKQMMIKRGIKSPDEADAVIMSFVKKGGGRKFVAGEFNNASIKDVKIDWTQPEFKTKHYGAIVIDKDLTVNCLCAVWDEEDCHLYIYDEHKHDTIDSDAIALLMNNKMRLNKIKLDKMLGNKIMFEDLKKTFQKELNKRFWSYTSMFQTVQIKPARKYDAMGSVAMFINLIKSKQITIDKKCRESYNQFVSWKLERGKLEYTGMREAVLLIISELMNYEPFVKKMMKVPEYSSPVGQVSRPIVSSGDPMGV